MSEVAEAVEIETAEWKPKVQKGLEGAYYLRRSKEMKALLEAYQRDGAGSPAEDNILRWVMNLAEKKARKVFFETQELISADPSKWHIEVLDEQLERGYLDHAAEIVWRVGRKLKAGKFLSHDYLLGYFYSLTRRIQSGVFKDIEKYGPVGRFQPRLDEERGEDYGETEEGEFYYPAPQGKSTVVMTARGLHIFQWLSHDDREYLTTLRVAEGEFSIARGCMALGESAFNTRTNRLKANVETIHEMLDMFRLPSPGPGYSPEPEEELMARMDCYVMYLARRPKVTYPQTFEGAQTQAYVQPDPIVGADPWDGQERARKHLLTLFLGKRKNMMLPADYAPEHLPLYGLAFRMVMPAFQEAYYTSWNHSGPKATDYSTNNGVGKATHTGRSCMVRPSDSDFICDVQIAAKRVLDTFELDYFNKFYDSCAVMVQSDSDVAEAGMDRALAQHLAGIPEDIRDEVVEMDASVRNKLGKRFIEVGISPLSEYRFPVDVSGRTLSDGTKPRRCRVAYPKPLPRSKRPSGSVSAVQDDALEAVVA